MPKLIPLEGVVSHLFLLTQDHNLGHETTDKIERLNSWDHFIQELRNRKLL